MTGCGSRWCNTRTIGKDYLLTSSRKTIKLQSMHNQEIFFAVKVNDTLLLDNTIPAKVQAIVESLLWFISLKPCYLDFSIGRSQKGYCYYFLLGMTVVSLKNYIVKRHLKNYNNNSIAT